MKTERNVPLSPYTTFRIGGKALFFCTVRTVEDLPKALKLATEKKVPIFVLGGGSNVLISDEGFAGVVIKMEIKGVRFTPKESFRVEVVVGAGERWDDLVSLTTEKGLYGLENLSLIPGTVGAAPVQNIGAYGVELKEVLDKVEVFDTKKGELRELSNAECQFGYRTSIFKKPKGSHLIITKVYMSLLSTGRVYIGYKDLALRFKEHYSSSLSPQNVRDAVIDIRRKKLPDPTEIGTAGSFFKNPIVAVSVFEKLKKEYPLLVGFPDGEKVKISLAWILDHVCNLRGFRMGGVALYETQPLALVNEGTATAKDVQAMAEEVARLVFEKMKIKIETEVRII